MDLETLGITKEDLIDRAAQKIADDVDAMHEGLYDAAAQMLEQRITKLMETNVQARVDQVLREAMEGVLDREIVPVDIFGEPTGTATTIRTVLVERARDFWNVKVNQKGEPTGHWDGKERYKWLMEDTVRKQFEKAVVENIDEVVEGFKKAMRKDLGKWLGEHVAKVFPMKRR